MQSHSECSHGSCDVRAHARLQLQQHHKAWLAQGAQGGQAKRHRRGVDVIKVVWEAVGRIGYGRRWWSAGEDQVGAQKAHTVDLIGIAASALRIQRLCSTCSEQYVVAAAMKAFIWLLRVIWQSVFAIAGRRVNIWQLFKDMPLMQEDDCSCVAGSVQ